MRWSGSLLVIAAASASGAMAVFGKFAFEGGATVGTLLVARFGIAAVVLWMVLLARRAARATERRGDAARGLALGAVAYAAQAGAYFLALERLDASLLALIVYTFPAIVAVAAIVSGRERADVVRLTAVAIATAGLAGLVLGAGTTGAVDPLGAGLALTSAGVYATYILVSDGISSRVHPLRLAALVCTGATATLAAGTLALGQLRPQDVTTAAWGWLLLLAVVSTVAAITLFFAGLRRVGPTAAAVLSTAEPLVTVTLACAIFGDVLTGMQLAGAAIVLAAVLALNARPAREALA